MRLPVDGFLVFNKDDKNTPKLVKTKFKTFGYSTKQKPSAKIKNILKVPGDHNVSNALASLQVGKILAIPEKIIFNALSEFKGSWRRFEVKQGIVNNKKITIISDYAHHPNEILATLNAAKEKYVGRNIWCVFQPHQHQRTFYLFKDFIKVFKNIDIDKVIITDIYDVAGRENKKINKEINSEKLVKKINKSSVVYCATNKLEKYIKEDIEKGYVLIIMGAGDIYKLVDKF